ncbi:branched-chain amino acid transport system substrate-binding protein [Dethiosulfatibacter aminovorans DSM 17477]|uniref:Branched-chain amino acid transport system substrate-binding protein n=1 Tax=Dethiosulfatibacter aminovorans DSM 17477 TaxID=1121476 RepID=A0A1M6E4F3_9FIRM|nr:ABC transporter substrate-binding protein [Dethiosulfatibacter aminovorans]SHI80382.1 branched-chain amino acid transport system substrate-binding protein [Dethiosulfatibacter aminovorans DSM 17477]
MKLSKRFLAVVLVVLMVFSMAGCADNSQGAEENTDTEESKEPIKVGFFAPTTGPVAADGENSLNAAKLAVENINASGGIDGREVVLVDYDDAFDTKQSVSVAQKLTTKDNVIAVVSGSYSGTTRAAAPVYQDAGIPMIASYAIHPDITKTGDYIFRQSFVGSVQGRAGGKVAVDMLGAKKISILYVDNDFGTTLSESFTEMAESLGAEIISTDKFSFGEKEFTPILTKIKQLDADLLYLPAYPGEGSQIVRQARDLGLGLQIMGTEGIDATVQFIGVAGEAAENVIITTNLNRDSDREIVQEFISTFTEKYGYRPNMVAASTYDAFTVLFNVMKQTGVDSEAIKDGLHEIKDIEAVTGIIKGYNSLGEVEKTVQVQIIRDGQFHYYGEISDENIIKPPTE